MASMKANFHPSMGQQIEIIRTEIRCGGGIGPRTEPGSAVGVKYSPEIVASFHFGLKNIKYPEFVLVKLRSELYGYYLRPVCRVIYV